MENFRSRAYPATSGTASNKYSNIIPEKNLTAYNQGQEIYGSITLNFSTLGIDFSPVWSMDCVE